MKISKDRSSQLSTRNPTCNILKFLHPWNPPNSIDGTTLHIKIWNIKIHPNCTLYTSTCVSSKTHHFCGIWNDTISPLCEISHPQFCCIPRLNNTKHKRNIKSAVFCHHKSISTIFWWTEPFTFCLYQSETHRNLEPTKTGFLNNVSNNMQFLHRTQGVLYVSLLPSPTSASTCQQSIQPWHMLQCSTGDQSAIVFSAYC